VSADERLAAPNEDDGDDLEDLSREELAAQLELLREQNRRLRREYARTKRATYRRTALGLFLVGVLAVAGGVVMPTSQTVLFALGGIGVFAGVLTWYLTPERFVAASVGEGVFESVAAVGDRLVGELGLTDDRVYVPRDAPGRVSLFVPQRSDYQVPPDGALDALFLVTDDPTQRGIAVRPTGQALFAEFERALSGELASPPATLADQLVDGLVEQFEIASSARVDVESGRVAVGVAGSVYGDVDRFDHPIASFLATGLARGLETPVMVTVEAPADDRVDYLVVLQYDDEE